MEARARALQRFERQRAREIRGAREPPRPDERERRHRGHELRPVDQREPLLRDEAQRLQADRRERVAAAQQFPVHPRLALADEREREVRKRSKIAARAHRATRRHARQHAAVQALDEELDELDPGARIALREGVRPQEHRRPDDLVRIRVADPARMATEEPELQLLDLVVRDRPRHEAPEAGVDAVRVLVAGDALDELASRLHLPPRLVRQRDGNPVDGDVPDMLDREVVPGQGGTRDHTDESSSPFRTCPATLGPPASSPRFSVTPKRLRRGNGTVPILCRFPHNRERERAALTAAAAAPARGSRRTRRS